MMSEKQSSGGKTKKNWILIAALAAIAIGAYNYWFSADAYARKGYELFSGGKREEAILNYLKAVEKGSKDSMAHTVLSSLNDKDYTRLIAHEPKNVKWYRGRASYYRKNKKFNEALADYAKAIEIEPNNAELYCERARSYRDTNNYDAALADYAKAMEIEPNNAKWYCDRAGFYTDVKNYDAALADYAKAIEIEPKSATSYRARAKFYESIKNHDAALSDYAKAIEVEPKNVELYLARARFYESIKNYDAALEDYSNAIEIGGEKKDEYYKERGRLYSQMRNHERAIADAKKSAHNDKELIEVLKSYGSLLFANNPNEAYKYYGNARHIYINADFWESLTLNDPFLDLGIKYENLMDYTSALSRYTDVIELGKARIKEYEGESAKLSYKIGELFDQRSKKGDLKWRRRDMYDAYRHRGDTYKKQGDWTTAVENYTKAIELSNVFDTRPSELWKIYFCRGECYSMQGDYTKAVSDFTKALEATSSPENKKLCRKNRGLAYYDMGDTVQARTDLAVVGIDTEEDVTWFAQWVREEKLRDSRLLFYTSDSYLGGW